MLTECQEILKGKESSQMTSVLQWCLTSLVEPWDSAGWYTLGKKVLGYSRCGKFGHHTAVTPALI